MVDFHRIPRKQLDPNIFYVTDDIQALIGISFTTAELEAHIVNSAYPAKAHPAVDILFDPTASALSTTTVQDALDEFNLKPMAIPAQETSAGVVATSYYQVTSLTPIYVGIVPLEAVETFIGIFRASDDFELEIVTDVTSDSAGTTTVVGNTWALNPYIQFSAPPGVQIKVKYGLQSTLGELPIKTLLSEGIAVGEIEADVAAILADIKGTAFDVAVPNTRDLVGLDNRVSTLEGLAHDHEYNATPVGAQNGLNALFTLPGGDSYVTGSLKVYLNGIKLRDSLVDKTSTTTFTLLVESEQFPDSSVQDYLEIDYEVGP